MSQPQHAEPRRILVVRMSALGDIVMASGLIPALKSRYPQAEISWLCEAASAPLLKHNTQLKQVIIWPRGEWQALLKARRRLDLWRAVKAFRARLRSEQFDLVLDAQGLLKSGVCAWFTGAPRRIGLNPREGSHLLAHERVVPPEGADRRIGSEYRYLAQYLGASEQSFKLNLSFGQTQLDRATNALEATRQALPRNPSQPDAHRDVLLVPFTTRPQKHWFEGHWAELAHSLRQHGLQPVMLGGPADIEASRRIASMAPDIINLTGQLKLDESVALVSRMQLLIGVDTGLTHMGTALHIPTLALFGSTCPYDEGESELTQVLYHRMSCSPCRRNPTCNGRFDCMRQHTPDGILASALALMASGPSQPI